MSSPRAWVWLLGVALGFSAAFSASFVAAAPSDLEERPETLKPKQERTQAERDKLEAMALFAAGRLHEQRQQLAEALKLYQRALRYDPDSAPILRQVYQLAFNLDRVEEGVRFALKLVQLDPSDQMLIRRLGALLTDRRDYAGAIKLYEKLVAAKGISEKSPAYVTLMAQMGDLYFLTENYAKAAECYSVVEAALDKPMAYGLNDRMRTLLLGNATLTYERFGVAFLKAKDPKLAIAAFQKADKAAPNKGLWAFHQAQVLQATGEPAKALAELEVYFLHQVKSHGVEPYELLAKVLKDLDREKELLTRLEKAREADPENPPLRYYLADQYRLAGQLDKAEPLYVDALKAAPQARGYEGLITLYRQKPDYEALLRTLGTAMTSEEDLLSKPAGKELIEDGKAVDGVLAVARKLAADNGGEKLTYAMRVSTALLATEAKKFDAVNEFFQLASQAKPPDEARLYMQWGLTLFVAEQYPQAVKVLEDAIAKGLAKRDDPTIYFHLSGALELAGRTDDALATARKAIEMAPTPIALLNQRVAWILYHAKRHDDAIAAYLDLIAKFPGSPTAREARLILSNIHVIKKDMAKAEEYLEQVLDEYPDDPGASNDLGYLWADQGKNLERALKMVQLAVEHDPDNEAYLDSLGWALYKLGRYGEAIEKLKKAIELDSDPDAVILEHLGDCHLKLNQKDEAIAAYKKALESAKKSKNADPTKAQELEVKLKAQGAEIQNSKAERKD